MDIYMAGAMAALTVDVIIYPLDTYKTRLQSRDFVRGGVIPKGRLYQGIGAAVLATLPAAGVFFSTYEGVKGGLGGGVLPDVVVHACSSAVAEAASCLVLSPAEVIKQNAQMLRRETSSSSSSSSSSSVQAFRNLGLGRLFSGYPALLARNLPFTAMQFPIYEHVRDRVRKRSRRDADPGLVETGVTAGISAGAAGAVAAFVTTPVDVVKTRVMVSAADGAGSSRSRSVVRAIWADRGFRGFFRGAALRSVWTALGSSLYLGSYDMAKLWLSSRHHGHL
ncbi:hypothetical protein GQ602_006402 [Ophiocordyceps camponoti-floridani]|uniref:Mitochondrial carrier protein n=1 Tax=Ophiocordyceps camponoti-floridani TaxID=2030778 RepID=A0A8H4Q387_9HYPO|nr:hypothetical protein GQ602_006402 [Ophiocordyceps camponoti-floridani]